MSINATQRVLWKDTAIGDYAFVTFEYTGNNDVRIIADAKGVKIRGTNELGGGYLTIKVSSVIEKSSRFAVEQFFTQLDTNFTLNTVGDLKISDDNGTLTLTDCYLDSFSQSSEDQKLITFDMQFTKSL